MQSLGIFKYTDESMTMTGQVFFPILFALMSVYLAMKNKDHLKFPTLHLAILILAVVTFVLTLAGSVGRLYYFYPSIIVYYLAFALLVLDVGFRIAAMPKAEKKAKPKKQKKVAARSAHLVAKPQSTQQKEAGE